MHRALRSATPILAILWQILISDPGEAQRTPRSDVFNSNSCETPDRARGCAPVRWGWGNCPGSREACDWCYGQRGVFAYVRRTNRTYKLSSGCENLETQSPSDVFWVVTDDDTRSRMEAADADCRDMGSLGLICQDTGGRFRSTRNPAQPGAPDSKPSRPPVAQPSTAAQQVARQIIDGWRQPGSRLKAGVSYTSTSFGGRRMHAVRVSGGNGLRVAFASDAGGVPLNKALSGKDAVISPGIPGGLSGGVTGTFSNWPARKGQAIAPGGPVIQGGKVALPNRSIGGQGRPVERSFLGWDGSGFFVADLPATDAPGFRSFLNDTILGRYSAQEGVGGLGRLLAGGMDVHSGIAQGRQGLDRNQAGDTRNARAVAGVSRDGGTLFLLVEEGNGAVGQGATTKEMADILLGLGALDGVILDGGGSAQIAIPSRSVNNHAGDGRNLPTWILF
jgi:hypothetical protein